MLTELPTLPSLPKKPDTRSSYAHLLSLKTPYDGNRTNYAIRVFFKYLVNDYNTAFSSDIEMFLVDLGIPF